MSLVTLLRHTLHSFAIGLFFVVSAFAHNIYYLEAQQLLAPVLVVWIATAVWLCLAKLLLKDWAKSGLFVSFFLLLFFCYGATHTLATDMFGEGLLAKHSVLGASMLLLVVACLLYLKSRSISLKLVKVANVFGLALLALPLYNIAAYYLSESQEITATEAFAQKLYAQAEPDTANLPDIVYLTLDGYGRADQLQQNYSFDNSSFIDALEQKGFQVANQGTANYCRTAVSVAAALNLNYLQNMQGYSPGQSYDVLDKLAEEATIIHFLKKYGYTVASFAAGFKVTDLTQHAVHYTSQQAYFSEFYHILISKTPFAIVEQNKFLYQQYSRLLAIAAPNGLTSQTQRNSHYNHTTYTLENLPAAIGKPHPSFVFADVLVGHPPFMFGSNGHYEAPNTAVPAADGSYYYSLNHKDKRDYIEGLQEQTQYLNTRLLKLVEQLQRNSIRPTIIILQGDHGPGAFYHQTDVSQTNLRDRFSVLNAVYVPRKYKLQLPEELSTVNTLRYILNSAFRTKLPILPNRHYYSGVHTPCTFTEVTQQLHATPRKTPASRAYSRLSGAHTE